MLNLTVIFFAKIGNHNNSFYVVK